nr:MAG TPA: hypothetical protein [Caudoviricetes sp.]
MQAPHQAKVFLGHFSLLSSLFDLNLHLARFIHLRICTAIKTQIPYLLHQILYEQQIRAHLCQKREWRGVLYLCLPLGCYSLPLHAP